ncbi:host cell factor 1-like isoform X3 [Limulus polyphemus]|uniref:Host cell factor 1-like isoform X3 n=1 Tax=Limulus polyphemus TaxID=6850 RepID=A0ABM1TRN8_LIMPO|nr:host cell factor 1-like isoform X3 [Limulus polyphemus]
MEENRLCSVCLQKGTQSKLRLFQINFEEAVFLCENKNCYDLFPSDLTTAFVRRHVSEITVMDSHKKKKSSKSKCRQELAVTGEPLCELSTDSTLFTSSKDILQDFLESLENYNFNAKNQIEDINTLAQNDSSECCLLDSLEECSNIGLSLVPDHSETIEQNQLYSQLTHEKDWAKMEAWKQEKGEVSYSVSDSINTHLVTSQESPVGSGKSVMPNGIVGDQVQDSTNVSLTSVDANKMSSQLVNSLPVEEKTVNVTSFTPSVALSKQNRTLITESCDSDLRLKDGYDGTTTSVKLDAGNQNLDEKENFMGQDNTSSDYFTLQEDFQPRTDLLEVSKEIEEVILKESANTGVLTQQEICKSMRFYPLWKNVDTLSWLDAALSLIVHNTKLPHYFSRSLSSRKSIVETVYQSYHSVVDLLNGHREHTVDIRWNNRKAKFISESMASLQKEAFKYLKNKLHSERGQEDSPFFALMLLLNEDESLKEAFLTNYCWEFKCESCDHHKVDRFQKTILTVPRVQSDFTVTSCYLLQPCLNCGAVDQRRYLRIQSLSECIAVHFVEGLLTSSISSYDFVHQSVQYRVKGVIQYKTNCSPKHFVAWIRNHAESTWLCCDDLQGSEVSFQEEDPQILASEMHILVWEREESDVVMHEYLDPGKTLTKDFNISRLSPGAPSVHLIQNVVSHPSSIQVSGSALPKGTSFVSRTVPPDSTVTSAKHQKSIDSLAVCSKVQATLVTSDKTFPRKCLTVSPSVTLSCNDCLKPHLSADLKSQSTIPVVQHDRLSFEPMFETIPGVNPPNMTSFVNSLVTSKSSAQPTVMTTSTVNPILLTSGDQPSIMTTATVTPTVLTSGIQPKVMTHSDVNHTLLVSGVQPSVMTRSSVNPTLLKSGVQPMIMTTSAVNPTLLTSGVQPKIRTTSAVNPTLLTCGVQPMVMATSAMNPTLLTSGVQSMVVTTSAVNPTLLTSGVQPTFMTSYMNSTLLTSGVQPTIMTTSTMSPTLLTSGDQPSIMTISTVNPTLLTCGVQPMIMATSAMNRILLTCGVQPSIMTTSTVNSTVLTSGVQPMVTTTSAVNPTLLTCGVQPSIMTSTVNPTLLTSGVHPKVMTESTVIPTALTSGVQPMVMTTSAVNPTLLTSGVQPSVMTTSTVIPTVQSSGVQPMVMTTSSVNPTPLKTGVQSMVVTTSAVNPTLLKSGVQSMVVTTSAVNPTLLTSGVQPMIMTTSAVNPTLLTSGVQPTFMTSSMNSTLLTSGVQPMIMATSAVNPTLLTSGVQPMIMTTSTVNPTLLTSGFQPTFMTSSMNPTLLTSGVQPSVMTTSTVNPTLLTSGVQPTTITASTMNPTVMKTARAGPTCMTSCMNHTAVSELSSLVSASMSAKGCASDLTHDVTIPSTDCGSKWTAIYIMTGDDDQEPQLHLLTTVPADTSSAKALLESTGLVSSDKSVGQPYFSDVNCDRISQQLVASQADRLASTCSRSFLQNRLLKRKKTEKRMLNTKLAQKRNSHDTEYFNNPGISLDFDENIVPLGDNLKPWKTKKLQKVSEGSQKTVKQFEQLEVTRKENILPTQSVPSSLAEYAAILGSVPSPSDRSTASDGEVSLLSSSGIFDCGSTDVSSSESGSKKTSLSKQFFVKQIKTLVKGKCRSSGYEGYKPKLTPVRTSPTSRKRKTNSTALFNEVRSKCLKSNEIAQDEGSHLVNKIKQNSIWSDNIITELFG